ncbi:hypothetical protein [Arthrobacter sp. A2-55]|uniref:hypothetical protein n=1 Tax=Arthrobacter sp. A2-55 TaxID=2897337 RepID=UPI0021CD4BB7|nr:hypothetical protein [Arthrobacter sp. A2-55]MCU6481929.1 hypothetical protein [Arthrobacter sp. A2-55]
MTTTTTPDTTEVLESARLAYALRQDTVPGRSTEDWWAIRDAAKAEFDAALESAKADAWDEGHTHCFHVENPRNKQRNPYRKAAR